MYHQVEARGNDTATFVPAVSTERDGASALKSDQSEAIKLGNLNHHQ